MRPCGAIPEGGEKSRGAEESLDAARRSAGALKTAPQLHASSIESPNGPHQNPDRRTLSSGSSACLCAAHERLRRGAFTAGARGGADDRGIAGRYIHAVCRYCYRKSVTTYRWRAACAWLSAVGARLVARGTARPLSVNPEQGGPGRRFSVPGRSVHGLDRGQQDLLACLG